MLRQVGTLIGSHHPAPTIDRSAPSHPPVMCFVRPSPRRCPSKPPSPMETKRSQPPRSPRSSRSGTFGRRCEIEGERSPWCFRFLRGIAVPERCRCLFVFRKGYSFSFLFILFLHVFLFLFFFFEVLPVFFFKGGR